METSANESPKTRGRYGRHFIYLFIYLFQTNDKGRLAPLTCQEYGTSNILKSLNSKNTNEKNTT